MKLLARFTSFMLLAALALHAGTALAQSYPSGAIQIVVPFAPSGAVDTTGRLISAKLAEVLNQPVVVVNRPGAGGNLGSDAVAKAAPDGYTILLNTAGLAISHALYRKLPFDAAKDLVPVTQPVATTLILVAGSKLPVTSAKELIALAKSKPGSLNYGHAGFGSTMYFAMELFKLSAGIDILAVPYKGDAPVSTALMAGEVDVAAMPLQTTLQPVKAGRMRALGVTSPRRSAELPDVPTIAEAGVSGYEFVSWYGLFVPAKTPADVIETIHRATAKVINMPDVRDRLLAMSLEPVGNTPQEFDAKYKSELAKFARIVKEARVPLQD